ncbi:unnamed protein product [Prorocentrum cordatum]|uniref:Phospholipase B-like n=1 Tax=Prorocentrum cordatum TaxID=2364126 RepID=A0ABN9RS28_9DINO|nr:unnamed protein product [Polarella glacialis]
MSPDSVPGAGGAAERADLFESGWVRCTTGSTDGGDLTCDGLESVGESSLFDRRVSDIIGSTDLSGSSSASASGSAAARTGGGGGQRRIVASTPAGRQAISGGRPDAAGSFRVSGYTATAEAFEVVDPWVGLEQYNIDRLMGA